MVEKYPRADTQSALQFPVWYFRIDSRATPFLCLSLSESHPPLLVPLFQIHPRAIARQRRAQWVHRINERETRETDSNLPRSDPATSETGTGTERPTSKWILIVVLTMRRSPFFLSFSRSSLITPLQLLSLIKAPVASSGQGKNELSRARSHLYKFKHGSTATNGPGGPRKQSCLRQPPEPVYRGPNVA